MIHHTEGNRLSLGEPNGTRTDRVKAVAQALIAAGLRAPVTTRFRHEIWVKLLGNVAFNPISALTHGTLELICSDPGTRALSKAIMLESQAIAETFGVKFRVDVERRIEGARKVGAHKTSMLQDLERGRPLEIEALLGAVVEMADWVGIDMPTGRSILALVRQRAETRGHG